MRPLALFLAFLLVVTSLPASAAIPETAPPEASSIAAETPASEPTLRDMLDRSPRADFASGDRPSSTMTLAPGQAAPAEAPPAEAAPEKKSHKTLWIVLGIIAGAAVIYAIAESGGDDDGGDGGGIYD